MSDGLCLTAVPPNPINTKILPSTRLKQGVEHLSEQGFNLFSILDYAALPPAIQAMMPVADLAAKSSGVPARVLLLAHGGKQLWRAMERADAFGGRDPVDEFSIKTVRYFLEQYLGDPPSKLLYPVTGINVPLQQLGTVAGWHQPSPLGIGMNGQFGLWWAYRTAVYLHADLPIIKTEPLYFPACMELRLRPQSICAAQCVARRACPIAREHQYTVAQTAHHYRSSLVTLREWA